MAQPLRTQNLSIPSSSEQLEIVDSIVEAMAGEMGFSREAIADLGCCVTEAVMNAIVHAHHSQPDKTVDIRIACYADCMKVTVRDRGVGFDVEAIPDPTQPENLLNQGGRGLLLMRAMMDDVTVLAHPDGTEITMVKYLDSHEK